MLYAEVHDVCNTNNTHVGTRVRVTVRACHNPSKTREAPGAWA